MAFLSIVIPTRNRPELLRNAVESVLDQGVSDLEVIVSDNSEDIYAEQNKLVLASYLDSEINYVRPPSTLAMVSHWEWAINHASGSYVGILTDRMVFKKGAIRRICEILRTLQPNLLTYGHDSLFGEQPPFQYMQRKCSGALRTLTRESVVEDCQRGSVSRLWPLWPRMMNSVCETTVLADLRKNYGSVFTGVAPDYSFCFRAMDWLGECQTLDMSLLITTAEYASNGKHFTETSVSDAKRDFVSLAEAGVSPEVKTVLVHSTIPWTAPVPYNIELLEYQIARKYQVSGMLGPIDIASFYRASFLTLLAWRVHGREVTAGMQALEALRSRHQLTKPTITNQARTVGKQGLARHLARFGLLRKSRMLRGFSTINDVREYDIDPAPNPGQAN